MEGPGPPLTIKEMKRLFSILLALAAAAAPASAQVADWSLLDVAGFGGAVTADSVRAFDNGDAGSEDVSAIAGRIFDAGLEHRAGARAGFYFDDIDFAALADEAESGFERAKTHAGAIDVYRHAQDILSTQGRSGLREASDDFLQAGQIEVLDLDKQYALYVPKRRGEVAGAAAAANVMQFTRELFDILSAPIPAAAKQLFKDLVATVAIHETTHHAQTRGLSAEDLERLTPEQKDAFEVQAFDVQKGVMRELLGERDVYSAVEDALGGAEVDPSWLDAAAVFLANVHKIMTHDARELVATYYDHHHHS